MSHALNFCYGNTPFSISNTVFSYLSRLINHAKIYWLKIKLLFAQDSTVWAGLSSGLAWNHHAITGMWRLSWGWPPEKAGVIAVAGTAAYPLSPSSLSIREAAHFYLATQGSKRWKQKHPGLLESTDRTGAAPLHPSCLSEQVPGQGKYPLPAAGDRDYGPSLIHHSPSQKEQQ